MNIAFYLPNITSAGGVERALISLVNQLSLNDELNIYLITNIGNRETSIFPISNQVIVIELEIINYKKSFFSLTNKFVKVLKQKNIGILITVEAMAMLFTFIPYLFVKNKCKYVVWEHFNFYNNSGKKLRDYLRKKAAQNADLIVTLTERDEIVWKQKLNIKKSITHIYNISPFQNINQTYSIDSKKVIAVGRFDSVKGFNRLIKAWSIFERKYNNKDWSLNIIGYGSEKGNLLKEITLSKCKSVFLFDGSKGVEYYFNEASFYCMSSFYEGLPMTLIEAQSYNLPVVAFDIFAGPSEIIAEKAGILIEDNNLEAFADAIYQLTSNDNLRMSLSKEAAILKHRFSKDTIADRWIQEFKKLVKYDI